MAIQWCAWCLAKSGRTNARAACCKARMLATAPVSTRRDALARLDDQERQEQYHAILSYLALGLVKVAKQVRQRAYQREMNESGPDGAELLRQLVMEEYERLKPQ